jgi:malonyl-CoA O-methyltransferase
MSVQDEFSRYAYAYSDYNCIQFQVAQKLLTFKDEHPKKVLDLGCGSGMVYRLIDWKLEQFVGVDFSSAMLALHPKSSEVELWLHDFNDPILFENLKKKSFDRIYSASALQWADDLESIFYALAQLHTPLSLAIFTSGTFKTLYDVAHLPPLLHSCEEIIAMAQKYMDVEYELFRTTLSFESVAEMFRYIKRSGVSGRRNLLSLKEIKQLMHTYPLDYLEFEIVFIHI